MLQPLGAQAAAELIDPPLPLPDVPKTLNALLTCSLPHSGQVMVSLLNIERMKRSKSSPQSLQ